MKYFLGDTPSGTPREFSFLNFTQGDTPWNPRSRGRSPPDSPLWNALFLLIPRGVPSGPPLWSAPFLTIPRGYPPETPLVDIYKVVRKVL